MQRSLPAWGLHLTTAWRQRFGLLFVACNLALLPHHHLYSSPLIWPCPAQSLVLAPLFVWFELLFLLGYRPALRQEVLARIRANIAEHKKTKEQQKQPLLHEEEREGEQEQAGDEAAGPKE